MTMRQCNSCKHHIYVRELIEQCFLCCGEFMKNKNCIFYVAGELNQSHKKHFQEVGEEYPFTQVR